MSKTTNQLRSAIQGLNIREPFQLKKPERTETGSTENRSAELVTSSQGFFMLAHKVFADSLVRALPGESFRVFLWLSMQAYKFRGSDGTTRASFRMMASVLGIAESSVGRAIEALVKARLVKRVEINNKTGNRWWVSPVAYCGSAQNESTENERTQSECSENGSGVPPESKRSAPNLGTEHTQNGSNLRALQDPKNLKNLSLPASGVETIERYFAELKPERKRMSEWKAYESLKRDYSDEEILEALSGLKSQDPDGGKYHSPMAYLSVSIVQVLKTLRSVGYSDAERVAAVAAREAARAEADEAQKREDEEWRVREASFLKEFPSTEEQRVAIETYAAGVPFGGEIMRRGLAISLWWESEYSIKS